jgi:hypothetical protein
MPGLSSTGEEDTERTRTILIVDSDLGFICWLGCTLNAVGYVALPAQDWRNASALLRRLNVGVGLLVVNYSLPGASEFTEVLRRSNEHLRVIALVGEGGDPTVAFPGADASQSKFSHLGEVSETEWLESVEAVLGCDAKTSWGVRSSADIRA